MINSDMIWQKKPNAKWLSNKVVVKSMSQVFSRNRVTIKNVNTLIVSMKYFAALKTYFLRFTHGYSPSFCHMYSETEITIDAIGCFHGAVYVKHKLIINYKVKRTWNWIYWRMLQLWKGRAVVFANYTEMGKLDAMVLSLTLTTFDITRSETWNSLWLWLSLSVPPEAAPFAWPLYFAILLWK